jgi:hypothetical protein
MKKHWQYVPLAALAIAAVCIAFAWHIAESGYMHLIVKIFGVDFGFTQIKADTSFFWFGEEHRIPLYEILYRTALLAICVAVFFAWRHFRLRKHNT